MHTHIHAAVYTYTTHRHHLLAHARYNIVEVCLVTVLSLLEAIRLLNQLLGLLLVTFDIYECQSKIYHHQ